MKRIIFTLLFLTGIAYGQSNDAATDRLNGLGSTLYAGNDFLDTIQVIEPNGFVRWLKAVKLAKLNTTQQNALTVDSGYMVYNIDTNTVAFYDGSAWQYFASRAYARSSGGGGGGSYTFQQSITESAGTVNLVGDQTTPGNSKLYGTDGSGTRGWYNQPAAGVTDHGALTGLGDDDHTIYALLAGRSTGQTLNGGTGASESLTIHSTSNGTKGSVIVHGIFSPGTTGTYNMGATSTRWRYGFFNGLNINSSSAGADNTINVIPGFTITNGTSISSASNVFTHSSAGATHTTGIVNGFLWGTFGFTPSSGTGTFNLHRFAHTINQTGGASGVSRTLYIDPTITAAANYFAIATTQGKIQFNGLPTATTPDSIVIYEDGELKPTLALNMPGAVIARTGTTTTTSGTTETDLYTFTTPANTLNADNEFLEYYVTGIVNPSAVADGGNNTVRVYWAGTEIIEAASLSAAANPYIIRVSVHRTSSSNAIVTAELTGGGFASGLGSEYNSVSVTTTFSNTNIIKVTGQSSDADQLMNTTTGNLKRWR
jgi:hypothetical protein